MLSLENSKLTQKAFRHFSLNLKTCPLSCVYTVSAAVLVMNHTKESLCPLKSIVTQLLKINIATKIVVKKNQKEDPSNKSLLKLLLNSRKYESPLIH